MNDELAEAITEACFEARAAGREYMRAEGVAYQSLVTILRAQRGEVERLLRIENPEMTQWDSRVKARELVPSPVFTSRLKPLPFYT